MRSAPTTTAEHGVDAGAGDGLVLFDADCPFCRRSVRWLLARERADSRLWISGLQTSVGHALSAHFHADAGRCDSVWFVADGRLHRDSDALWRLGTRLERPWRALAAMRRVPAGLRDGVYRLVGRHRRRLAPPDDARLESHPRWLPRLTPAAADALGIRRAEPAS